MVRHSEKLSFLCVVCSTIMHAECITTVGNHNPTHCGLWLLTVNCFLNKHYKIKFKLVGKGKGEHVHV